MAVIVSLTPNPAVDITYLADRFEPEGTTRVEEVIETPGGKGLNVARVLHSLGSPVTVVAPLGGPAGEWIAHSLAVAGIAVVGVPVLPPTRRTITVVDKTDAHPPTLNEPGATLDRADWNRVVTAAGQAGGSNEIVTICGSLPPGVGPEDLGAAVVALSPRPVIVDTSGPALWAGAQAHATLLKPNASELRAATGEPDLLRAAGLLVDAGAGAVAVSLGHDGLLLVLPEGAYRTVGLRPVAGNPTGAGDAVVAAFAHHLHQGASLVEALPFAAAAGAAAVACPTAGEINSGRLAGALEDISIEEIS